MTIPSTAAWRVEIVGNAVATTFNFPHKFQKDEDLVVRIYVTATKVAEKDPLVLTTDYTVAGAGAAAGGSITLTSAYTTANGIPAATETVIIENRPVAEQDHDYTSGDAFPEEAHEDALDKLALRLNAVEALVARSLGIRVADSNVAGGEWDAQGIQIGNLIDPVDADHAASKSWVEGQVTSPPATVTNANIVDKTINPEKLDDHSANAAEQVLQRDPASLPTSLAEEIETLRYAIGEHVRIAHNLGGAAGSRDWEDFTGLGSLSSVSPNGFYSFRVEYVSANVVHLIPTTKQSAWIEMDGVLYAHDCSAAAHTATIGTDGPGLDTTGWKHLYADPNGSDFDLKWYDDSVGNRPETDYTAGKFGYHKTNTDERYIVSVYNDAASDFTPFDIIDGWMYRRTLPTTYNLTTATNANFQTWSFLAADVPVGIAKAVEVNTLVSDTDTTATDGNAYYAHGSRIGAAAPSWSAGHTSVVVGGGNRGIYAGSGLVFRMSLDDPATPRIAETVICDTGVLAHKGSLLAWQPIVPFLSK